MHSIVLSALLPVAVLIALGFALGRTLWIGPRLFAQLSDIAFLVLTPALLFRTMSRVHLEQLDLRPAAAYILTLALVFAGVLVVRGLNRTAAVLALAVTYSNAVMIGIPLISLGWGEAGLVTLLTLIPVHSLLLLTFATLVLEFSVAHETVAATPDVARRLVRVGLRALRKALLHPVPLPIVAGLAFAHTGLPLPHLLDQLLRIMGLAFGPLALGLVGMTLARTALGRELRGALLLVGIKNFLVPALAALLGWAFGMRGLPLVVMVVTAALPIGANVFVFSQRYGVAQTLVTAGMAVSTALSALTMTLLLLLFAGVR